MPSSLFIPHLAMPLSIREVTLPSDQVLSFVKAYQIQIYLSLIPAAIVIYDSRTLLLQLILFPPLTSCQYAHWTKRYAHASPFYGPMMTIHDY